MTGNTFDMQISLLKANIERLQRRIGDRPESVRKSKLYISKGKHLKLYVRDGKGKHYIRKGLWDDIAAPIVQNEYDMMLLALYEEELRILEKLVSMPQAKDIEMKFDEIRRRMIRMTPLITDEEVAKWKKGKNLNEELRQSKYWMDNHPYRTTGGEYVRSKSEAMIANRLKEKDIPYIYECPLEIGGKTLHPDFTILNRRTGKEIILEHFGMMDDRKYVEEVVRRICFYQDAGYFLADKLLATFEASDKPFDIGDLDVFIEELLT